MTWFRPLGDLFSPASIAGRLLICAALAFCLQVFTAIDRHALLASDTHYGVFPYWAPTLRALAWIAIHWRVAASRS
jgi:hypothetical protein